MCFGRIDRNFSWAMAFESLIVIIVTFASSIVISFGVFQIMKTRAMKTSLRQITSTTRFVAAHSYSKKLNDEDLSLKKDLLKLNSNELRFYLMLLNKAVEKPKENRNAYCDYIKQISPENRYTEEQINKIKSDKDPRTNIENAKRVFADMFGFAASEEGRKVLQILDAIETLQIEIERLDDMIKSCNEIQLNTKSK